LRAKWLRIAFVSLTPGPAQNEPQGQLDIFDYDSAAAVLLGRRAA
jgi:hypothetical protein